MFSEIDKSFQWRCGRGILSHVANRLSVLEHQSSWLSLRFWCKDIPNILPNRE